jgi:ABC-type transport system substrate-binding protein
MRFAVSCAVMADGPKVLRIGTLTAIGSLDPQRAHDFSGHLVISQVFESAYGRVDGRAEPRLVMGMPVRRDPRTFDVQLRSDVRFSDGSLLRAEDVAAAVRPALATMGIEVTATGDRLSLHARTWLHRPEDVLANVATKVAKRGPGGLLGTGPFAVADVSARGIRLVRNPYALRRARVDEIDIRWYAFADGRPDALVSALESGEVDFSMSLARDDVSGLQRVRKLFQPGMSTAFLAINTTREHFADAAARRAIALAIDRYRVAELCYANPAAFVARCLLPPGLGRGNDGVRHDPTEARAAIAGARLPAGLRMIRVWGPRPYLSRPDAVAALITQQLGVLDTEVETIAANDSEHYGGLLADGDYDLVLGGWSADTLDPIDYLESTLGSAGILGGGHVPIAASNYARWRDPETDRLLADARTGAGPRAVDEILARVAALVPLVPLMHGPRVIVHGWRVKGYDPDAGVFPDFAAIDLDD